MGDEAHYHIGIMFTLDDGAVFEAHHWHHGGPMVSIALKYTSFSKPQRRSTLKGAIAAVDRIAVKVPDAFEWLAFGKRTWKIDCARLRAKFSLVRDVAWLGDAVIEVEPEFETREYASKLGAKMGTRHEGAICLYVSPETIVPAISDEDRLRVLVLHGPENNPKHELLAWLRGQDIMADARTVGEMPASAQGSVNDRVTQNIAWAEKVIAIVSPDPRAASGSQNVVDEIGRCIGASRAADLAIVRQRSCADIWSNLAGVVRVEYDERIKETFLSLAKFLGALRPGRPES
jgi:hypothetical protein